VKWGLRQVKQVSCCEPHTSTHSRLPTNGHTTRERLPIVCSANKTQSERPTGTEMEELLQLFAFHKRSSSSTSHELRVAQYAEKPMVKDAVDAYNRPQSVKEREQILSKLVFTFTRDQINNQDFDLGNVSRGNVSRGMCPDVSTSPFRSSAHSGEKGSGVTPMHVSANDLMKRIIADTSKGMSDAVLSRSPPKSTLTWTAPLLATGNTFSSTASTSRASPHRWAWRRRNIRRAEISAVLRGSLLSWGGAICAA